MLGALLMTAAASCGVIGGTGVGATPRRGVGAGTTGSERQRLRSSADRDAAQRRHVETTVWLGATLRRSCAPEAGEEFDA